MYSHYRVLLLLHDIYILIHVLDLKLFVKLLRKIGKNSILKSIGFRWVSFPLRILALTQFTAGKKIGLDIVTRLQGIGKLSISYL
jgi:hypothetical protein